MPMKTASTQEVLDILSTLIAFPTTFDDSNIALIDWVSGFLASHGVAARIIYDPDKRKANLLGTIGPAGDDGIILSGHTDVVPTTGQQWDSDPFRASVRNDRLYGRGAADMKGFIAAVLAQVPYWQEQRLRRPLHLAFTYDEEVGCLGVRSLIAEMEATGFRASSCIVGEPTGMEPVTAHKGRMCGHCSVRGKAAHSSLTPQGVNAIDYAARMILFIQGLAARESQIGQRDVAFDVPFSTLATTLVHGGSALNIIPNKCEFSFDYRYLPGVDPTRLFSEVVAFGDQLVSEMRERDSYAAIQLRYEETCLALNTAGQSDIVAMAKALALRDPTRKVAFSTEAGYFDQFGIPAIVCGPGSIDQAHRPNEYIAVSELTACTHFLGRVGDLLCAS